MGTTCDICRKEMEVTDDAATEKRTVSFTHYGSKATAKIVTCPECFTRMTKTQVGIDSAGQAICIPKLTWKKWPERTKGE